MICLALLSAVGGGNASSEQFMMVETFDECLVNAYDVVLEKVGITHLAMIVNMLVSASTMASV